ncbi:MAG: LysM peptidoglycan-binding domain-containing protein [Gammaproteobacteria bacterium]|nr:LysM peptidoglycan-binding domain-containing protein [Gammaproteobacteria bacterium]
MTSTIRCLGILFAALLATTAIAADTLFPQPAELDRDVAFWKAIFSDYSTDEGALHDNRDLSVVYERMDMPATVSRRERNRRVGIRRKHYQKILRALADGKRNNPDAEEQRVLDLWPDDVSNATLRAAAGHIRFQHGLSDRFEKSLQRAGRWRSHVDSTFARLGVPIELAALPHVESSYNPAARSHVGASGIWQFTRSTGRRFMQVDHVLDERNDPFRATEAAGKLLAYNYSIVGNWPMAITAYNHGLAGVRRAMRQFGDTAYTEILRNYKGRTFGFASRNFYVAFLAALQIDQDPQRYFPGVVPEPAVDYDTFRFDDYVPVEAISAALGISERELAKYNPAMQATIWQGSKYVPRDFEARVPRERISAPAQQLLTSIAARQHFAKQLPDLFHTIARGDTLSEIADEYGTRVSTLAALNNLGSRHRIRAGQRLRLPAAGPAPGIVAMKEREAAAAPPAAIIANVPAIAAGPEMPVSDEATEEFLGESIADTLMGALQSALLSDPSDYNVAVDNTIEVHPLETLGHYADWLGIKTQRLRDINGLAFRTPVAVGQRIKLDLSQVNAASFEKLRSTYHRELQDTFFRNNTITGIQEHTVASGESVWILSLRRYKVPIWLFRQYNPALDMSRVAAGTLIRFPLLVSNNG